MQIAPGILKDFASAGTNGLTPILWAPDLVEHDYDVNVFEKICDTTGILSDGGDSMVMTPEPVVTGQRDFGPGDELVPTTADTPEIILDLNRSFAFAPLVDDIQESQMKKSYAYRSALMRSAAIASKNDQDEVILQSAWNDADVNNTVQNVGGFAVLAGAKSHRYNIGGTGASINTPLGLDETNVVNWLTMLSSTMGEANVPMGQRWVIIPEWVNNLFFNSDLKNASVMGGGNASILRGDGRLPWNPCGLEVFVDEHLTTASIGGHTCTYVLFGGKNCIMYASQLKKLENSRPSKSFETILKGLITYGFKTHRPTRLGVSVVY